MTNFFNLMTKQFSDEFDAKMYELTTLLVKAKHTLESALNMGENMTTEASTEAQSISEQIDSIKNKVTTKLSN